MSDQVPYKFKTEPFEHQREWFEKTRDKQSWGILWEQGTGKTKISIDTAADLYRNGKIDSVLVVAPNGVHANWSLREIEKHCPTDVFEKTRRFVYHSNKVTSKSNSKELKYFLRSKEFCWMFISYDALITVNGKQAVWDFIRDRTVLMILDESARIKNIDAQRTKTVLGIGGFAAYRRILTGTPVTAGPFDIFPQIKFLSNEFWHKYGFGSYTVFKRRFGIFKKMEVVSNKNKSGHAKRIQVQIVVGYRDLDYLASIIEKITCRVTKEQVLKFLPPKLYKRVTFELSPQQRSIYNDLKNEFMAFLSIDKNNVASPLVLQQELMLYEEFVEAARDGVDLGSVEHAEPTEFVSAELAIVRLLKLCQITSGYIPSDAGDPIYNIEGPNRRLETLKEVLEDSADSSVIIWARFVRDIDLICDMLGDKCVRYDGSVKQEDRTKAIDQFQSGEKQYFVATDAASEGLTLTRARTVVYYNNSFKLSTRLQSEDRAHRIGQQNPVLYIDIEAEDTVDGHIIEALLEKRDIAREILRDEVMAWL